MTERDAFLEGIIRSPDDDLARAVYADWLEEHALDDGDRLQSQFIQVQLALHQQSNSQVIPADLYELANLDRLYSRTAGEEVAQLSLAHNTRILQLRRRERELFTQCPMWLGNVTHVFGKELGFEPTKGVRVYLSRGFGHKVRTIYQTLFGGKCLERGCGNPATGWNGFYFYQCRVCSGKGVLPDHSAHLFASHPIRQVMFDDFEPWFVDGDDGPRRWYWFQQNGSTGNHSRLPDELFDVSNDLYSEFDSAEDARSALSTAAIALGRKRVAEMRARDDNSR